MKLIHYCSEKFTLKPREYNQKDLPYHAKPHGFWVSVEGIQDWKSWCEEEKYNLGNLLISYEIVLKEDAKILHLNSAKEILSFSKKYKKERAKHISEINWNLVKSEYQGIIIAPYQWDCRFTLGTAWYYGWDCASGCIWDLTCIDEFKLIEDLTHGSL
jgi:hypothetical protein